MSDIQSVLTEYHNDSQAIHNFCNDLYSELFSDHFSEVRELYKRLRSKLHPITDDELEYILTVFPMELFAVAEKLNSLRLDHEVVKLKNREKLEQLRKEISESVSTLDITKTEKQDMISRAVSEKMVEYEILLSAYNSVITRVENEQSFSRELIMGAKKIWDSRRNSEQANPVSSVVTEPELPEYSPKSYIK